MNTKLLRAPGWIASTLMIFFTIVWTYWGMAEMYHEGWWGSWLNRLPYLAPIVLTLIPALIAFRWPFVGGGLVSVVGISVAVFFGSAVALIGMAIGMVGVGFIIDGLIKRREDIQEEEAESELPWWRRNWRYLLLLGLPFWLIVLISVNRLPVVLSRVDDGDRSARLIKGNDVELIWAPEGPGWNWIQSWGGYPSWQSIALYGLDPIGFEDKAGYEKPQDGEERIYADQEVMDQYNLCLYLNEDGTELMDEQQNIWRMPTMEEIVRSMALHEENAGCTPLNSEPPFMSDCELNPDKESPLWDTSAAAIYYWTADEYDEKYAWFASYNGMVNAALKTGGNPRHGYRCVREP